MATLASTPKIAKYTPFMDVESYYSTLPCARNERLQSIETRIFAICPEATRSLKYKMPTFETPKGWMAIGNQKHHISVYTCSSDKIAPYIAKYPKIDHGKGCLRFKDRDTLDFEALEEVIRLAL